MEASSDGLVTSFFFLFLCSSTWSLKKEGGKNGPCKPNVVFIKKKSNNFHSNVKVYKSLSDVCWCECETNKQKKKEKKIENKKNIKRKSNDEMRDVQLGKKKVKFNFYLSIPLASYEGNIQTSYTIAWLCSNDTCFKCFKCKFGVFSSVWVCVWLSFLAGELNCVK